MDEGDTYDVATVNAPEDSQFQGKENEFLVKNESDNMMEVRAIDIPREGNYSKSSIQEFMDILDGKNVVNRNMNIVGSSENLDFSFMDGGEERVQELTLENYSAALASRSDNEVTENMQEKLLHVNTLNDEGRCLKEHDASKGKEQATSDQSEMPGCKSLADLLDKQSPFGGVRTKMVSKTGFSEYFVKSTLKGTGVMYRGQPSAISRHDELKNQKEVTTVSTNVDSPGVLVQPRIRPTLPTSNNALVFNPPLVDLRSDTGKRKVEPALFPVAKPRPACSIDFKSDSGVRNAGQAIYPVGSTISTGPRLGSCGSEAGCGEDSLRAWLKSRQSKAQKVDSLAVFRRILDLVDSFHMNGEVLQDLRPSCFKLLQSNDVKYNGRLVNYMSAQVSSTSGDLPSLAMLKRPREQAIYSAISAKQQRVGENVKLVKGMPWFQSGYRPMPATAGNPSSGDCSLEEKWYQSPEEHLGMVCTTSSNVYSLGILLFELLSHFNSEKAHASAMADLRQRILPPNFLSENPKEAGFCLWLLHPEPSLRPTTRDVLQSEVVSGFQKLCEDDMSPSIHEDETESELMMHFLLFAKEKKQKHASKLTEELSCIEADINEANSRRLLRNSLIRSYSHQDELSNPSSGINHSGLLNNISQLETAYFSVRSQIPTIEQDVPIRSNTDLLSNRENSSLHHTADRSLEQLDPRGAFFDGLCKYARYNKLEVCGTARTGDFTNSGNVIFSLSFDRDEEYFAAAGVSKKIKIFQYQALCNDSVDIHYPVAEMRNESKLSCVCWNTYIQNYLTSTDYDGIVKLWDASTGQEISKFIEHERRAWSVDFSQLDPTKLASGSDDCSVRLWNINERNSLCSIRNVANVCCVQFSPHSSHLLAFGSADYKIYCYDLRNPNVPWCTLSGHDKAVSYVKFLDSGTLVSASTDNTLKQWNLTKSSSAGLSNNACNLTYKGHTNEKNFVGLSVTDGYISCGSETNEVYTYYKSLPMPITSHKFGSMDPVSGKHTDDANGQFVSSVCWRSKSHNLVAANSSGRIKVLKMA